MPLFFEEKKYLVLENKKPFYIIHAKEYELLDEPFFKWIPTGNFIFINCTKSYENWNYHNLQEGQYFLAKEIKNSGEKKYQITNILNHKMDPEQYPKGFIIKKRY